MSLLAEYLPSQTPALFLLRHGHIDTGAESRYVGQTDYPLSPRGRERAMLPAPRRRLYLMPANFFNVERSSSVSER